uniref:Beta 1,3(4)-glucanase n=1 Tax=Aphelenchoides besseyi TaxID=269767 RepID=A0A2S1RED9_9BILA|nr:beta 1,3(4)-glucanase [Aphelenchoides besseyi]
MLSIAIFCFFCLPTSIVSYQLVDNYQPNNLLNNFDFFTGDDPTHGFVNYINRSQALSAKMIRTQNNQLYLGVDQQNIVSDGARGRDSIRIFSKKSYDKALIILDLEHMPAGQCGTWSAFWTFGPDWPNNGEVDIIEGVHMSTKNAMTLHTSPGCLMTNSTNFSGQLMYPNCDVKASGQPDNSGCSITGGSYGSVFNKQKGGVYMAEWTDSYIRIWFIPRSNIPSDILDSKPDPSKWGKPLAEFTNQQCDLNAKIRSQNIVFNVAFCGDWAGDPAVWRQYPQCLAAASNCADYVRHNPFAFKDTYWLINSLKIYKK